MYCKRCGTPLHLGVVICPECGARQRRQASSVRCANCHSRVPVTLSVCPQCGRDVRPAGPRWGIWLAVAIALVVMVLWGLNKLPVEQIGQDVVNVRAKVAGLVKVLGPAPTAEPTDSKPQTVARTTAVAAPTISATEEPIEATPATELTEGEEGSGETSAGPAASIAITATLEALPPTAQPITATITAEPTVLPTATPAPTATAVPPTATAAPPTATQPAPTATAAKAAGAANTYRVKSGDTLSGIAGQFKVGLDALLAANRLTAAATLRIGQELIIPGAGVPPRPTATPRPRATTTPTTLPPTPAPYLPLPALANPGDQARYSGDREQIFLAWDAIPGMTADDKYQVILRWTEQGGLQEKSDLFTTATSIQVPTWLWGRADQPVRKYQWFIRAVRLTTDGQGGELVIPLSPPSEIRTFYWN